MIESPSPSWLKQGLWRSFRVLSNLFWFLAALAVFLIWLPKFEPIFRKLDEKGELPTLTKYLVTMSDYDRKSYHGLSLLVLVELIALDEVMFQIRRQFGPRQVLARFWPAFVFLGGLCIFGLLLFAMQAPIFKMSTLVANPQDPVALHGAVTP